MMKKDNKKDKQKETILWMVSPCAKKSLTFRHTSKMPLLLLCCAPQKCRLRLSHAFERLSEAFDMI